MLEEHQAIRSVLLVADVAHIMSGLHLEPSRIEHEEEGWELSAVEIDSFVLDVNRLIIAGGDEESLNVVIEDSRWHLNSIHH